MEVKSAWSAWIVVVLSACWPRGEGCVESESGGCNGADSSSIDSVSIEDTDQACEINNEDIQVVAFCPMLTIDWIEVNTGPDGSSVDPYSDIGEIRLMASSLEVEDLVAGFCTDSLHQVDVTAWTDLETEDGSSSLEFECDSEPWLLDFEEESSVIAIAYTNLEDHNRAVGWAVAGPDADAESNQLILK